MAALILLGHVLRRSLFILGPKAQFKRMTDPKRLGAFCAFMFFMIITLVSAFVSAPPSPPPNAGAYSHRKLDTDFHGKNKNCRQTIPSLWPGWDKHHGLGLPRQPTTKNLGFQAKNCICILSPLQASHHTLAGSAAHMTRFRNGKHNTFRGHLSVPCTFCNL